MIWRNVLRNGRKPNCCELIVWMTWGFSLSYKMDVLFLTNSFFVFPTLCCQSVCIFVVVVEQDLLPSSVIEGQGIFQLRVRHFPPFCLTQRFVPPGIPWDEQRGKTAEFSRLRCFPDIQYMDFFFNWNLSTVFLARHPLGLWNQKPLA